MANIHSQLLIAAEKGDTGQCLELIQRGANVNAVCSANKVGTNLMKGRTPLIMAAIGKHVECIQLLIEQGADVNYHNNKHMAATPLLAAVIANDLPCVQLLVEKGANIEATGRYGMTALGTACQYLSGKVAEYLMAQGANLNHQDINGDTPIHIAIKAMSSETVKKLVFAGADWQIVSHLNYSPLQLAHELEQHDIVNFLTSYQENAQLQTIVTPNDSRNSSLVF